MCPDDDIHILIQRVLKYYNSKQVTFVTSIVDYKVAFPREEGNGFELKFEMCYFLDGRFLMRMVSFPGF